ncbi:hypothetical protein HDV00_001919 [Rhizophlyctis rosea]|nr:hypothetical protein HDV00_001919 [Rhizophlyctis rosea]
MPYLLKAHRPHTLLFFYFLLLACLARSGAQVVPNSTWNSPDPNYCGAASTSPHCPDVLALASNPNQSTDAAWTKGASTVLYMRLKVLNVTNQQYTTYTAQFFPRVDDLTAMSIPGSE